MPSFEHEFDAAENESFSKLAWAIRFFATLTFIYGGLQVLSGLRSMPQPITAAIYIGIGVLLMVVAGWLWSAGTSFRDIVNTEGSDVMNLIFALGKLRRVYTLWAWVFAVICVLIVLAIFLAVGRAG